MCMVAHGTTPQHILSLPCLKQVLRLKQLHADKQLTASVMQDLSLRLPLSGRVVRTNSHTICHIAR